MLIQEAANCFQLLWKGVRESSYSQVIEICCQAFHHSSIRIEKHINNETIDIHICCRGCESMFRLNLQTPLPKWKTAAILEGKALEKKIYTTISVIICHDLKKGYSVEAELM